MKTIEKNITNGDGMAYCDWHNTYYKVLYIARFAVDTWRVERIEHDSRESPILITERRLPTELFYTEGDLIIYMRKASGSIRRWYKCAPECEVI